MRRLRVLWYETPDDAYFNLAIEEAIPRALSQGLVPPTLRFFRNRRAVVIGYFQYAEREVNLEYAKVNAIQVVRRFTGGGAVYHDLGNLNYALSLPFHLGVPRDMIEYYFFFLKPVVAALRRLGVEEAKVGKLNDLNIGSRKVGGTAASTRWEVAFFHGTLLINTNLEVMERVLKIPRQKLRDKGISSLRQRVINLQEVLGSISVEEVVEAIVRAYEEALGLEASYEEAPSDCELELSRRLYEKRYSRPEWNLERKPLSWFEV